MNTSRRYSSASRIVEDAAAAEDEQIELLDLGRDHLLPRQRTRRDGALDLVPGSVSAGFRENTVMSAGDGRPQLAEDPLEDRLVAEVHAAVRARDADAQSPVVLWP